MGRRRAATRAAWILTGALTIDCTGESIAGMHVVGGEWIVSSASRPGIVDKTDGISREGEEVIPGGDPACLHRAA